MVDEAPLASATPGFAGFDVPRQNWFKMPNTWTDITADITSLAELKVVEYVLKHTWGYPEYGILKLITTDEFMHGRRRKDGSRIDRGTGLSKPSVIAGIKSALAHGFLEELVDDADLGRIKKYYALRMMAGSDRDIEYADDDGSDDDGGDIGGIAAAIVGAASAQRTPDRGRFAGRAPRQPAGAEDADPPAAGGVKNPNSDVKNLYPDVTNVYTDVKNLDINCKDSLHRSEKDSLERQQQKENVVVVVSDLQARGIGSTVARRLARDYSPDYIARKQEYLAFLMDARPDEVKKPAAWLRKAIEDDFAAPDGFNSPAMVKPYPEVDRGRIWAAFVGQEPFCDRRAAEKARAATTAANWEHLQAQYGTTPQEIELWRCVQTDLSYGGGGVYEAVATAEILKVTDECIVLGIPEPAQMRRLEHPGYQNAIKRAFKPHTRKTLALELVATYAEVEQARLCV